MIIDTFDKQIENQLVQFLEEEGHEVQLDSQIEYDMIVDGKTVEIKFFRNTYNDFYLEMFNCFDPISCPDCRQMGNKNILLGWGYRGSYCKADYLMLVHTKNNKISQILVTPRDRFLHWVYDTYLIKRVKHSMITTYQGKHRTMGIPIPIRDIPDHLLSIHKLMKTKETLL